MALKHLKWVEIITQEVEAVKRNAMYILPTDDNFADLIFISNNGNKRRVIGGLSSGGANWNDLRAGNNVTIDRTNPLSPIINASGSNGKDTYTLWLEQGNEGTVIDFLNDITRFNSMTLSVVDGELIVDNYMGDSAELVDGELILN